MITSERGLPQHDPLSGFLFGLMLQGTLQTVQQQHLPDDGPPTAALAAYRNDSIIATASPHTPAAFRALFAAMEPLGVQPQLPKSTAYSRSPQHAAAVAAELGMTHAADGTTITSVALGIPNIKSVGAEKSAAKLCTTIEELMVRTLPAPGQFLLLHMSPAM